MLQFTRSIILWFCTRPDYFLFPQPLLLPLFSSQPPSPVFALLKWFNIPFITLPTSNTLISNIITHYTVFYFAKLILNSHSDHQRQRDKLWVQFLILHRHTAKFKWLYGKHNAAGQALTCCRIISGLCMMSGVWQECMLWVCVCVCVHTDIS